MAEAQRLGSPLDEARGQFGLAQLLIEEHSRKNEAKALLEAAERVFQAHGAAWDLERLGQLRLKVGS